MGELASYTRAMRERQQALEARGDRVRRIRREWETPARRAAPCVSRAPKLRLASRRSRRLRSIRIAAPGLELKARYLSNAPLDPVAYARLLATSRTRDRVRKSAAIGPQRDDLVLEIDGHTARQVASQGQHRAIVLALKAAEIDVIATARGVRPILLLDDVSSELDRARTAALVSFLGEQRGQFFTTTRPELIVMASEGLRTVGFSRRPRGFAPLLG